MCLFPLGGGGFNMRPVVPPTDAALKAKRPVMICLFVHLALALTFFFVTFSAGLQDLFMVLILWCATSQMHYCHLIVST